MNDPRVWPDTSVDLRTTGPFDEETIVRTYKQITGIDERLKRSDAAQVDDEPTRFAEWVDLGLLIGVPIAFGFLSGGMTAPFWIAVFLSFFVAASYLALSYTRHRDRLAKGEVEPGAELIAYGPIRSHMIESRLEAWRQSRRQEAAKIDPTSMSVIEPVARHLAGPILEKARILATTTPSHSDASGARKAEARRDELLRQAEGETDPIWRQAAQEQAARLDERAKELQARYDAGVAAKERILADARELEAELERLRERRRLLEEMGAERGRLLGPAPSGETENIRLVLQGLFSSLQAQQPATRDHVEAHLEMNALERG